MNRISFRTHDGTQQLKYVQVKFLPKRIVFPLQIYTINKIMTTDDDKITIVRLFFIFSPSLSHLNVFSPLLSFRSGPLDFLSLSLSYTRTTIMWRNFVFFLKKNSNTHTYTRNNINNNMQTIFFCHSAKFQRTNERNEIKVRIENNNRTEIFRYLFVWWWWSTTRLISSTPKPIIRKNFLYLWFSHTIISNHRLSTSSLHVAHWNFIAVQFSLFYIFFELFSFLSLHQNSFLQYNSIVSLLLPS